eukprot:11059361-Karenia_brevis.AAC.1
MSTQCFKLIANKLGPTRMLDSPKEEGFQRIRVGSRSNPFKRNWTVVRVTQGKFKAAHRH